MFNTCLTHALCFTLLCGMGWLLKDTCVACLYQCLSALGCLLFVSYQLASYVDNVLPRFRVKAKGKAVFITGCDRGFGRLLARRLDSLGFQVWAGCLDPDGDDVRQLTQTASADLRIVPLDVTSDESVDAARRRIEQGLGDNELWALVNNAGVIERGELEWTPLEKFHRQFEVNTFGVVRVTQAFLPLLRKFQGRVVTVASIGGRQTFSGFAPYCMSKYATISFCDGLRLEMHKFGVKVITVEPFSYQTGMTEAAAVFASVEDSWRRSRDRFQGCGGVYDDAYVAAFARSVGRFNASTALPDASRAVDAMVEAVCAVSPHYSYVPGDARSLLDLWLSRRAPKTIVDAFVRRYVTFDCDVEQHLRQKREPIIGRKEE